MNIEELPDAETLIRINRGVDEFMDKWKQTQREMASAEKKRREARWAKKVHGPNCNWTDIYESGFHWVFKVDRLEFFSPSGKIAASVGLRRGPRGFSWHVWDEHGVGGENSCEPTIDRAKMTAESAALRWGRHFKTQKPKSTKRSAP